MSPEEHLAKIVAKCRELLALAEKRTPGEWRVDENITGTTDMLTCDESDENRGYVLVAAKTNDRNTHDMDYIAACAGAAEAGWRATISSIEKLPLCVKLIDEANDEHNIEHGTTFSDNPARELLNAIIAAWPEELLV